MWSVASALAVVHLCWLRVRLPGLLASHSLDALLMQLTTPIGSPASSFELVESMIDRAEAIADRVPWLRRSCLYVSLARYAIFRRFGLEPQFVLAVHPEGPDKDGHAWLEFEGIPYREPRTSEFVVAYRFPALSAL